MFNLFNRKDGKTSVKAVVDTSDYAKNDAAFEMVFNDAASAGTAAAIVSLGGRLPCNASDTLTVYRKGKVWVKFDFRYAHVYSSKKRAVKFQQFIAVGLDGYFYLYDLSLETGVLFLDLGGYFEELVIADEHLLVAYHAGIYCLAREGKIKWLNTAVGIDGVIINKVEEGKIYGCEQVDPPDGWFDFVLDLETGARIS